jgi:hypothetical protein
MGKRTTEAATRGIYPFYSSGGTLTQDQLLQYINKQSCAVHCYCNICEEGALFKGLSHRHFCKTSNGATANPSNGVAIAAADSQVVITKILYPPQAFYFFELDRDELSEYRLGWVTADDGEVLASIVRLDVGTKTQQEKYEAFQMSIYQALHKEEMGSLEAIAKVIDEGYNQRSRKRDS